MRTALSLALVALTAIGAQAEQQPSGSPTPAADAKNQTTDSQQPTFRAGVDVLTVDVVALDSNGRPVTDLSASDFTVRIDGQPRRVVSSDLVRLDAETPGASATLTLTPSATSSVAAARGRRILIAVDQLNIRPGQVTPLMKSVEGFVDRLTSRDQAAFVTFPTPGPRTEFTSDKAVLKKAMQGLIGNPPTGRTLQVNIGLLEAITISEVERPLIPPPGSNRPDPPILARVLERNCRPGENVDMCRANFLSISTEIATNARTDATISVRNIESILRQLAAMDGPKSLLLVSSSLLVNDERQIDELIRIAEGSRTSIYVIAVEREREDRPIDANPNDQGPATTGDRGLMFEGLSAISSPGGLSYLSGNGSGILDRLATELSAYYLLGVESRPGDETREQQKVAVEVRRRGTRVRSSLAFARNAAADARAAMEYGLREALASSTALSDVPINLATFIQRDRGSDKGRLSMTAQVGASGAGSGEMAAGYVVMKGGEIVASSGNSVKLTPGAPEKNQPLEFGAAVTLDPGAYSLRVSVVDAKGRKGTVVRDITVRRMTGAELTTSDLMVGSRPAAGQAIRAVAEPRINTGELAAYLELYSTALEDLDWTTVDFEVAKAEDSPALVTESAEISDGPQKSWRIAGGLVDVSGLEPGRYVLRAKALLDSKTVATVVRPFVLEGR